MSSFWDVKNAFPSMGFVTFDSVCSLLPVSQIVFMKQRHWRAMIEMEVDAGKLLFVSPGCGGMQGDTTMFAIFSDGFNAMALEWVSSTAHPRAQDIWARLALNGEQVLSGTMYPVEVAGYADDTTRTTMIKDYFEFHQIAAKQDEKLDEGLKKCQMKQHAEKKEVMFAYYGKHARENMQESMNTFHINGKIIDGVRYFGSYPSNRLSVAIEVKTRLHQAQVGWIVMGKTWTRSDISLATRLTIWTCFCRSTMMSGLEAQKIPASWMNKLEMLQIKQLRILAKGELNVVVNDHIVRPSNNMFREKMQVATIESELCMRRLSWLQQIGKHWGDHINLLATSIGETNF